METLPRTSAKYKSEWHRSVSCEFFYSSTSQYGASSEFVWTLCNSAQYVSINFLAGRLHKVFCVVYAKVPWSGVHLHHLNAQKKLCGLRHLRLFMEEKASTVALAANKQRRNAAAIKREFRRVSESRPLRRDPAWWQPIPMERWPAIVTAARNISTVWHQVDSVLRTNSKFQGSKFPHFRFCSGFQTNQEPLPNPETETQQSLLLGTSALWLQFMLTSCLELTSMPPHSPKHCFCQPRLAQWGGGLWQCTQILQTCFTVIASRSFTGSIYLSMLYYFGLYYIRLYHILCYMLLYLTILYYITLHYIILYYIKLYYTYCTILYYVI